jgi:hypothetical protein
MNAVNLRNWVLFIGSISIILFIIVWNLGKTSEYLRQDCESRAGGKYVEADRLYGIYGVCLDK